MTVSRWIPESDPQVLRRIGKTGEEATELAKVCFRIVIQGLHGVNPSSGKTNLHELWEEAADVQAQIELCVELLGLPPLHMADRIARKKAAMHQWEAMFATEGD